MVFEGYIRFAGTEVVNTERLQAYVDNGIKPLGMSVTTEVCPGLSDVVTNGAEAVFRTPLQDEAPWVDLENPDTFDFAGLVPLAVTGVDDTTRTVNMVDTLRDGALPGRVRRGARTVGVTALLMGRTSEGVQAGLDWLRRTLHGSCDDLAAACGQASTVELFTVCPGPISPTADLDSPPTVQTLAHPFGVDPGSWVVIDGTFDTETTGEDGTDLIPYEATTGIDGGDADDDEDDEVDGGGSGGDPPLMDGGGAYLPHSQAILAGLIGTCTNGPVTITWTLGPTDGTPEDGAVVQLVLLDDANNILEFGPKVDVTGVTGDYETYEWVLPFGVGEDFWKVAILASDAISVQGMSLETYTNQSAQDCIAPYRRFLPNTVTTSGPTVVDTIDAECAYLLQVEWIWVVSGPYRYGVTEPLLEFMSPTLEPTLAQPGVTWDNDTGVTDSTPWNCEPLVPLPGCAVDPCAPGFDAPPAAPAIPDPSAVLIGDDTIRDMWVCVGPEQTPVNDGLFTFELAATGAPIVGARVRVYDTADNTCVVPDLCDFAYEFNIDYIPEDGVLTIDGPTGTYTTLCPDAVTVDDAAAGIRGAYGGPLTEPIARCNRRYFIRIQWLDEFPRTCAPFYTTGDPEGDLTFSVYVTPREG